MCSEEGNTTGLFFPCEFTSPGLQRAGCLPRPESRAVFLWKGRGQAGDAVRPPMWKASSGCNSCCKNKHAPSSDNSTELLRRDYQGQSMWNVKTGTRKGPGASLCESRLKRRLSVGEKFHSMAWWPQYFFLLGHQGRERRPAILQPVQAVSALPVTCCRMAVTWVSLWHMAPGLGSLSCCFEEVALTQVDSFYLGRQLLPSRRKTKIWVHTWPEPWAFGKGATGSHLLLY